MSRTYTKSKTKTQVYSTRISDPDAEKLRLLTWNIDGLNPKFRASRTNMIIDEILGLETIPDAILLQEVVVDTETMLRLALENQYHFCEISDDVRYGFGYYTLTCIRKCKSIHILENERIQYKGMAESQMGRDLHSTSISIGEKQVKLMLLNSHMESLKESSSIRTAQLCSAFSKMLSNKASGAILAGDLNMRQSEQNEAMKQIEGAKGSIIDVYEFYNRPAYASNTWVLPEEAYSGENKKPYIRFSCRFDRVYHNSRGIEFAPNTKSKVLQMLGTNKRSFRDGNGSILYSLPSDHYGILVDFCLANFKTKESGSVEKKVKTQVKNGTEKKSNKVNYTTKQTIDEAEVKDKDTERKLRAKAAEKRIRRSFTQKEEMTSQIQNTAKDIIDLT